MLKHKELECHVHIIIRTATNGNIHVLLQYTVHNGCQILLDIYKYSGYCMLHTYSSSHMFISCYINTHLHIPDTMLSGCRMFSAHIALLPPPQYRRLKQWHNTITHSSHNVLNRRHKGCINVWLRHEYTFTSCNSCSVVYCHNVGIVKGHKTSVRYIRQCWQEGIEEYNGVKGIAVHIQQVT